MNRFMKGLTFSFVEFRGHKPAFLPMISCYSNPS
jgi:hypothetical protein